MQRLSDAIISEKLGSQAIETGTTYSQIEIPAKGQTFIQDTPKVDDIHSFIDIKVKERHLEGKPVVVSPNVISRGNQWCRREMLAVFSG